MVNRNIRRLCIITLILMISILSGCSRLSVRIEEVTSTINDIAYNVNRSLGYTVYIKEYNEFVPYFVLTNYYDGKTLLLRKYLLRDEMMMKNVSWEGSGGSHYIGSIIDKYLNNEFLSRFSSKMRDTICNTNITVTTRYSIQKGGGLYETEVIPRKIFLLSSTEVGIKSGMTNKEGKPLEYFSDVDNLAAIDEIDENPYIYWLRTPYLVDDIKMWTISYDGSYGRCPVALKQRLRPAFCLNSSTPIMESREIIENSTVFVLGQTI